MKTYAPLKLVLSASFAVGATFLTLAASAEGPSAGALSADEVARRAESSSADLEARRAEVAAAGAQVDQALVAFAPRLGLVARYTRLSDIDAPAIGTLVVAPGRPDGPLPAGTALANVTSRFPVYLNQGTFAATLSVPLSDYVLRLVQAKGAAEGNERSAKLAHEAARFRVRSEAKLAYYGFVRAKLSLPVAEQALASANAHLEDAKHAFEAGGASKADVLRVESQVAQAEQLVLRTRNLVKLTEAQLGTLVHDPEGTRYELSEDLDRTPELPELGPGTSITPGLVEEAYTSRAEVSALLESTRSLDRQASAVRAGAYPRIDLVGDVTAANPNPRYIPQQPQFLTTWSAGAQLSWTPNDTFSALAAARGVDARKAQADAEAKRLRDAVRLEVSQAIEAVENARGALETSKKGLSSAEEGYRVRRSLFQSGRATSAELTDSETELTRARLDALGAKVDVRVAEVRFAHATGRDRRVTK